MARTMEKEQAARLAEAMRKHTKVQKEEEFQRAVREGAFESDVGKKGLYKSYEALQRRHERRE